MRTSVWGCLVIAPMLYSTIASAQPAPPPPPPPASKKIPDPATGPDPFKAPPGTDAAGTTAPDATPAPIAPPPPPPWATSPTSTQGTQLLPPSTAVASANEPPVEQRLADLEARLRAAEDAAEKDQEKTSWLRRFKLSAYVQAQLLIQRSNASGSPNVGPNGLLPAGIGANDIIARSDGSTTNGDFFRLRRARLKAEFMPSDASRLVLEIDPFPRPTGIPQGSAPEGNTIARQVEAQGIARWSRDVTTEFAVGMFKPCFGYDLMQSNADRPFMERAAVTNNMFPGERDMGVRAYTTLLKKKLAVQLALTNGVMQGEKSFALIPDLNRGKDFWGRINYNFGSFDLGFSGTYGQGQNVDPVALKFKQFPRWAVNFEVAMHHTFEKSLGETRFFAELVVGRNEDRGVQYSFALPPVPIDAVNGPVQDLDQRGVWFRVEQELTKYFFAGFRYDYYTPNSTEKNNQRDAYAFVGGIHLAKGLDLRLQYDYVIDNVHRANTPAPSRDFHIFSSALQARF